MIWHQTYLARSLSLSPEAKVHIQQTLPPHILRWQLWLALQREIDRIDRTVASYCLRGS